MSPLSICALSLSLLSLQQTKPAASQTLPVTPTTLFTAQNIVAETRRLAITPNLDGKISPEEWDAFTTGDSNTYFQWEPGKIHAAAQLGLDQDLVLSLDLKGDGWLVGKDNYEVRVSVVDGKPVVRARGLDATNPNGPVWFESAALTNNITVSATADAKQWTVELSIADNGLGILPENPGNVSVRMDTISTKVNAAEPYLPRTMTALNLVFDRSAGLPANLKVNSMSRERVVVPGENFRLRQAFNGNEDLNLKRVDIRTEGSMREATTAIAFPFPSFDKKGRAFVDYESKVANDMPTGYHVLRTTLTTADGLPGVIQNSIRVAPLVDFDIVKEVVPGNAEAKKTRIACHLNSNSPKRLDGVLFLRVPEGWKLDDAGGKTFIIYNSRGMIRRVFDITVPGGVDGTFPLQFTADIGGRIVEKTLYLTVRK